MDGIIHLLKTKKEHVFQHKLLVVVVLYVFYLNFWLTLDKLLYIIVTQLGAIILKYLLKLELKMLESIDIIIKKQEVLTLKAWWKIWIKLMLAPLFCSILALTIQQVLIQIWINGNKLQLSVKKDNCIHFSTQLIKALLQEILVKMVKL